MSKFKVKSTTEYSLELPIQEIRNYLIQKYNTPQDVTLKIQVYNTDYWGKIYYSVDNDSKMKLYWKEVNE